LEWALPSAVVAIAHARASPSPFKNGPIPATKRERRREGNGLEREWDREKLR